MKLTFVFDQDILRHQPLGPCYISSLLKAHGHEVSAVNVDEQPDYLEQVVRFNPDVIAYSISSGQIRRFVSINKSFKERISFLSLFGGPHPTFFPKMIDEDSVDIICTGEGEYPTLELLNALAQGRDYTKIPSLTVKKDNQVFINENRPFISKEEMNELPFPDRELMRPFSVWKERTGYVMTGRGCPYDCSFCFNHVSRDSQSGRFMRQRSVDNVIAELRWLRDTYKVILIHFQDDTFIINRRWLKEFLPRYRDEIGLPFVCNVRGDLTNREMVQLLAEAGCVRVAIGIESGSEEIRRRILAKNMTDEQVINACDLYNEYGIKVMAQNIFGSPGETVETALSTVDLNIRCKAHIGMYSFFTPYPGTHLGEMAAKQMNFTLDIDDIPYGYYDHLPSCIKLDNREIIEKIGQCAHVFTSYPKLFYFTRWFLRNMPIYSVKVMYMQWLYRIKQELYKKGPIGIPSVWHHLKFIQEAMNKPQPEIPVQHVCREMDVSQAH